MFDPIGPNLKNMAEKFLWGGIVVSVLIGCALLIVGASLTGIAVRIIGSIFAWIGAHLLYGFGQLIENTDKLAGRTYEEPEDNIEK